MTARAERASLHRLATLHGIEHRYRDASGVWRTASPESLLAVLHALGAPVEHMSDVQDALAARQAAREAELAEPGIAVAAGTPLAIPVNLKDGTRVDVHLQREGDERAVTRRLRVSDGAVRVDDGIAPGFHRATLAAGARSCVVHVVAHPTAAKGLRPRSWGLFAPMYAIRDGDAPAMGQGTLRTLERLAIWAAGHGASFVSTLPLLATAPGETSPYSPVSRRHWSERLLDPLRMPELAHSPAARARLDTPQFRARLAEARRTELVDPPEVSRLLRHVLEPMAEVAWERGDRGDVARWAARNPDATRFAQYAACADRYGYDWYDWPSDAVADPAIVRYHVFVQYAANRELTLTRAHLRDRGVALALDLPVGTARGGFETWENAGLYVLDASVGAPPDQFFDKGQNWGFPPVHPEVSRRHGHDWFRAAVAAHTAYAGLLRIDHVMGLHRLWWVPHGAEATDGVYVRYATDELFGIASILSHRHDTTLVGENLGTVPPAVNRALARHGWLGMYELQFAAEALPDAELRVPSRVLAGLNTHDMATFAGWCTGADLDEQVRYGQRDPDSARAERERRRTVVDALGQRLGTPSPVTADRLLPAALELLAASRAPAVQVSAEDLWGETSAHNLPGTSTERPNWRARTSLTLEEIRMDDRVATNLDALDLNRGAPPGGGDQPPCPTDTDLFLFGEGTHRRAYQFLGAHAVSSSRDSEPGVRFSVWAPNAREVDVVGDWNSWRSGVDRMEALDGSGVHTVFVPAARIGDRYKFRVHGADGRVVDRADPFAFRTQEPPATASVVANLDYDWYDGEWMVTRGRRSALDAPVSIYEVHLGSFLGRKEDGSFPNYRELAHRVADHATTIGFTHVELLPVTEHPFYGSWGYQTTSYFAPSARYGTPQDLMYFVDHLHQRGLGVIFDWVPSHFPGDEFALARFDGTALYEHDDPRLGFHPDWNSCVFNYGRHEVRSFLLSSARFWADQFHADGIRVDAVASMLYRDYSRREGEWIPNVHGGRENLEAISLLQQLNATLYADFPDIQTYAEESTAWPNVSRPVDWGGLGFGYKWDMGWMHDTLLYLSRDPIHRRHHHGELTFRSVYRASENYVLPLSHDEVVHGKGSLLNRMAGDDWQKHANLRLLLGYQWTQPGKKLLFSGGELGQPPEWDHDGQVMLHLVEEPAHGGVQQLVGDLNRLYRTIGALHELDCVAEGFEWVESDNAEESIIAFLRWGRADAPVLVVANFTPVPRLNHRVGSPTAGAWRELLNSDALIYGGSGFGNMGEVETAPVPMHGRAQSLVLTVPPLGIVLLEPC